MASRRSITFATSPAFDAGLDDLARKAPSTYARSLAKMEKFEQEYTANQTQGAISAGFDMKRIDEVPGEYTLYQVDLTADFRATFILPDAGNDAYWSDRWKKTRLNNRKELRVARDRTRHLWEDIKRAHHDERLTREHTTSARGRPHPRDAALRREGGSTRVSR